MKILFLNVGKVMCSAEDHFAASYYNDQELFIPRSKLALLDSIIEDTGTKIVITGDWRFHYKSSEIHEAMKSRGLKSPRTSIIGKTPDLRSSSTSDPEYSVDKEVSEFLKGRDDVEVYVILDDYGREYFPNHKNNLIVTDFYDGGLSYKHAKRVKDYLGRNEEAQDKFQERKNLRDYLSKFEE
jgi:hypothetical protein